MPLQMQNATMGQVAQVKIPMRLVKEAFGVSQATLTAVGEHAAVLVRGVEVVMYANNERQPGSIRADIRGKGTGDAYLTTKDYGKWLGCACGWGETGLRGSWVSCCCSQSGQVHLFSFCVCTHEISQSLLSCCSIPAQNLCCCITCHASAVYNRTRALRNMQCNSVGSELV